MKRARPRRKPDPDAPELDAKAFARGMPLAKAPADVRDLIRDFQRRYRGKQKTPTKALVTLRVSRDVLARYRGTGAGWQTRMNADLTKAAQRLPQVNE